MPVFNFCLFYAHLLMLLSIILTYIENHRSVSIVLSHTVLLFLNHIKKVMSTFFTFILYIVPFLPNISTTIRLQSSHSIRNDTTPAYFYAKRRNKRLSSISIPSIFLTIKRYFSFFTILYYYLALIALNYDIFQNKMTIFTLN